jgi:microcystin-dependent protein
VADPFVAEIRVFPFTFPPKGWAFCDGQLLPLSQNTALFALLGTYYGGNGKSNFALPDLQGSAAMHTGQGQGLSLRDLGQIGGAEAVTLLVSEMPLHNHNILAANPEDDGNLQTGGPTRVLAKSGNGEAYGVPNANVVTMAPEAIAPAGGSLPHNNMQPYLTLSFCIAMQGVFPPRQ